MKKYLILPFMILFSTQVVGQLYSTINCKTDGILAKFDVNYSAEELKYDDEINIYINAQSGTVDDYEVVFTNLADELEDDRDDTRFKFERVDNQFPTNFSGQLILKPNYSNSELASDQKCDKIVIDIPVANNENPSTLDEVFKMPLKVSGSTRTISIDGKNIIRDDSYADGAWNFQRFDAGFEIDESTGIITYTHAGQLANGTELKEARIKYEDWEGNTAQSNIQIEVVSSDKPVKVASQTLSKVYVEGIEESSGTVTARNPTSLDNIPIAIVGHKTIEGNQPGTFGARINGNGQLVWSPAYDLVEGGYTKTIHFLVQPTVPPIDKDNPGVIKVNVKGRTHEDDQERIEEAKQMLDQGNAALYEKSKEATCYMAYVVSHLENGAYNLGTIASAYDKVKDVGGILPSDIIPFADIALDLAKNARKKKREKVALIVSQWKDKISPLKSTHEDLTKKIREATSNNYQDEFTSEDDAKKMNNEAQAYIDYVNNLTNDAFQAATVITVLWQSKRDEVRNACRQQLNIDSASGN